IATLLLTGIIVDTGLFAYANTTSKTLTVAADLVEHGAKIDNISEQLFNQQNLETLLALKNLIASIELYEDGKIALCSFSLEDILAESFSKVNIEGMASVPLKIKTVKISGFIRVINPNLCKVSLRAKQGYDVHSIAKHFGGGGHILAAGCHIEQDLLVAKSQLLALIKKRMIKVAEL
ncbi:MAG: DHH family phosphoesterase, partial [Nitrospinota bacterium]